MAGICPNCRTVVDETTSSCPKCATELLSPQEWKEQREFWINATKPEPALVSENNVTHGSPLADKKEFILGFYLGSLVFFFAFLTAYLIFGEKLNL